MKRTSLGILLFLLSASPGFAQVVVPHKSANLTAQDTACAVRASSSLTLVNANSAGSVVFTIGATSYSGTVSFYSLGADGATWTALNVTPSNSSTPVTSVTSTSTWNGQASAGAYTAVCMLVTSYVSGTVNAAINLSPASASRGSGSGAGGSSGAIVQLPVAVCQGTGVSLGGSGVAANLPGTLCVAGSSTVPQSGMQSYAQASLGSQYVDYVISLPSTWTKINSITFKVLNDTATSGTDYINFQYACVADTGTADPTYAAVQQASGTVPGTINEFVTLTLTNPTISGCAASNVMYIRIGAGTGSGVFASGNLLLAAAKVEMQ